MLVTASLEDGSRVLAETEGLRDNQSVDRVVDGQRYENYLNNRDQMFKIAEKTRREYFERLTHGS